MFHILSGSLIAIFVYAFCWIPFGNLVRIMLHTSWMPYVTPVLDNIPDPALDPFPDSLSDSFLDAMFCFNSSDSRLDPLLKFVIDSFFRLLFDFCFILCSIHFGCPSRLLTDPLF